MATNITPSVAGEAHDLAVYLESAESQAANLLRHLDGLTHTVESGDVYAARKAAKIVASMLTEAHRRAQGVAYLAGTQHLPARN